MTPPSYQFGILHLFTAMTLIAVQLAVITSAAKVESTQVAREAVIFFLVCLLLYVPVYLVGRHNPLSRLGAKLAVVKLPIYRSRSLWMGIVFIVTSVCFLYWKQAEFVMKMGALNIAYLLIVTFSPTAIIGTHGVLHDLNFFTPWQDWHVVQQSEEPGSDEIILKKMSGSLPQSVHIPKGHPHFEKIYRLAKKIEERSGDQGVVPE